VIAQAQREAGVARLAAGGGDGYGETDDEARDPSQPRRDDGLQDVHSVEWYYRVIAKPRILAPLARCAWLEIF
jgi:hypothetical protein